MVEALKGRYQLGVVSNGFADVQYKKLAALRVDQHFRCVVLSGELGVAKPDPAIFHDAAGRLGASPGQCLYVGDSYLDDVVGAKTAGMCACWFNPCGRPAGEVRPDMDIRSLDEIVPVLCPAAE